MKQKELYKTAIYCRLSLDDGSEGDSSSIHTQKMLLEKYCKDNGYEIYDYYIDDGYSGLNYNRPNFQRMLQDIENGKIDLVITKDLSKSCTPNESSPVSIYTLYFKGQIGYNYKGNSYSLIKVSFGMIDVSYSTKKLFSALPFNSLINPNLYIGMGAVNLYASLGYEISGKIELASVYAGYN